MIQNIEDLTEPPVVGEMYMVPCVLGTARELPTSEPWAWWPISGPAHSDREYIGFEPVHFHFDHRFTPEWKFKELLKPVGLILTFPGEPMYAVVTSWDKENGVQHRPMECLRNQRSYPEAPFKDALANAYTDKRVTCGKCPHRGLSLLSLPREPGTDIMKWDLKTGCLVKK